MASEPVQQLALNVQLRDDATLDNFFALPGQQAMLGALECQLQEQGEFILYLHGGADTGKTHLLQAACHLAGSSAM